MNFFKQVSLFEDLTQGDLRRLAQIVHERSYRDGEYIFEQGKPGTVLYLESESYNVVLNGGLLRPLRRAS